METLKRKLSSRKLWAAIVGIAIGLGMVFGLDESIIGDIAGAVVSAASLMTYIITEGRVDATAAKKGAEDVRQGAEGLSHDHA